MREKLNENPLYQAAAVGVLLLVAAVFVFSSMGGGGGAEEGETTTTSATVIGPTGSATVTATTTTSEAPEAAATPSSVPPVPAPPLPRRVSEAFLANRTVVLLIVRPGGIDDAVTAAGALPLSVQRDVALFVVPARKIARYAAITQGVDVSRVPALVVVRPRKLDDGVATASVSYGFQSPQSIAQAVIDARYDGQTLSYHP